MKGGSPEEGMYVIPFAGFIVSAIHRSPVEIGSDFHGIILVGFLDAFVAGGFDCSSCGGCSSQGAPSVPPSKTRQTFARDS